MYGPVFETLAKIKSLDQWYGHIQLGLSETEDHASTQIHIIVFKNY